MISIKIQGVMKGYFSQVKGAEGGGIGNIDNRISTGVDD